MAEYIVVNYELPYLYESPGYGQGTGFFIDKNGTILTCAHVVSGSKNLYIEIPSVSNKKYACHVVAICPTFDIAIIKCNEYKSKDCLELGNSDLLEIGKEIQTVGYPVSAKTALNSNNLKYTIGIIAGQQKGLIQTDSAINPGNSGGPMLYNGKVIGINSMKLVSQNVDNVGYAVPINYYKTIKNNVNKEKIIYRPTLGINYSNTNVDYLMEISRGKLNSGIMVSKIYENSMFLNDSKKSIIKEGAIITEIDGYKIDNFGYTANYKWIGTNINIDTLLNKFESNKKISIKYFYESKFYKVNIKLKPTIFSIRMMYPAFEEIPYYIFGGIVFVNLSLNLIVESQNLKFLGLLNNYDIIKPKLVVSSIFNTNVNILKNIQPYDIICKVNDIDVSCIDDLRKALKKPISINGKSFVKIENDFSNSIIMNYDDLVEDDYKLSVNYRYPLNTSNK